MSHMCGGTILYSVLLLLTKFVKRWYVKVRNPYERVVLVKSALQETENGKGRNTAETMILWSEERDGGEEGEFPRMINLWTGFTQ